MRSTTVRGLLQDIELVPQHQDFDLQLPWRFEAVAQHANNKEADCKNAAKAGFIEGQDVAIEYSATEPRWFSTRYAAAFPGSK